jgi:hypothetical protein
MAVLPAAHGEESDCARKVTRHAWPYVEAAPASRCHVGGTPATQAVESSGQQGGADAAPLIRGCDKDQRNAPGRIDGHEAHQARVRLGYQALAEPRDARLQERPGWRHRRHPEPFHGQPVSRRRERSDLPAHSSHSRRGPRSARLRPRLFGLVPEAGTSVLTGPQRIRMPGARPHQAPVPGGVPRACQVTVRAAGSSATGSAVPSRPGRRTRRSWPPAGAWPDLLR